MKDMLTQTLTVGAAACALAFVTGCQSHERGSAQPAPQPAAAVGTPATTPSVTPPPAVLKSVVRIKAGLSEAFTDSSGNVWEPDRGFDGGDVIARDAGTAIANTKDAGLFLTEHYGMSSFACDIPSGKYVVKLYFAETFDGITGPGQRVFSFNVQGREFKDFDIWVKAGGPNRAYIETVPAEVTNGKLTIAFTSNVENPAINAIEIVPQS